MSEVGKKVVDLEDGIAFVLSDIYVNDFTVFGYDNSVERKRGSYPLIFADTAVVVCLEESHAAVFIKRALLEVYTGRVDMSRRYAYALGYLL